MNKTNGAGITVLEPREPAAQDRSMVNVQASRAVAEVQASMTIAKKFPRDEKVAFTKIMAACSRKALAEAAIYEYPRGGEKVSGPSIRMAEAIAQSWGNISTGIIELDRREGESLAMAYCVDLETNSRKDITFIVPHIRDTKSGGKVLTETRDIYEIIMNMGSRRLRNAIMAVIPSDIFEAAESKCVETLSTDEKPIQDRIREMLAAFNDYAVTAPMIAAKFGCKVEALSPQQLVKLRGIYQSLKDGVGAVKDFFDVASTEMSRTDKLNQESKAPAAAAQAPEQKSDQKPEPGSFASFGAGPLFSARQEKPAETLENVQVEVADLKGQLGYTDQQFLGHIAKLFPKVAPQNLTLEQVKKLRDSYAEDLGKRGAK